MPSPPDSLSPEQRSTLSTVMKAHGYDELTQTQFEAFRDGALDGGNWVLVAETGNGKTLVGECRVAQSISNGGRVAYLVPSHRLVAEKADEIQEWTDPKTTVTTNTRDADSADVTVRTFDSFFRGMLADPGAIESLDLVVLDDFHEIYSSSRGPGIEKAITAIRESEVSLFAMSATVGNPDHLARWLDADLTISSERRGVPLTEIPVPVDDSYDSRGDQIADIIAENKEKSPFLVFCNSRRNCEARAKAVAAAGVVDSSESSNDIQADIESLLETNLTRRYRTLIDLLEQGVAYHHAGLERPVQDYITELVHDGVVSALFCTPTLAYGFDAPIQSVIVSDLKRWTGQSMEYVAMYEYVQWIGRAGRPGYGYDEGFAFPMYRSYPEADEQFQFDRDTTEKSFEPVTSHLDNANEFRVFLLEIIGAGWTTQSEIESFVQSTFYWAQLHISAARLGEWGMDRDDPADRIKKKLGTEASWLVNRELLEQRANGEFSVTDLGWAMTRFVHDTWGRYSLTHILSFLDWLRSNPDFDAYDLLTELVRTFDQDLGSSSQDSEFRKQLSNHSLGTGDVGQTVGLLAWYWCAGTRVDEIEDSLGIDASYLSSTAYRIADLLSSVERFFSPLGQSAPGWYETLRLQLEYGVTADTVQLVDAVDGLGRVRVTTLRDGLRTLELQREEDYGDGSLAQRLVSFKDDALGGDDTLFRDILATRSTFGGIGPTIAQRVLDALPSEDLRRERPRPFQEIPTT